jgi:hypothetical protein
MTEDNVRRIRILNNEIQIQRNQMVGVETAAMESIAKGILTTARILADFLVLTPGVGEEFIYKSLEIKELIYEKKPIKDPAFMQQAAELAAQWAYQVNASLGQEKDSAMLSSVKLPAIKKVSQDEMFKGYVGRDEFLKGGIDFSRSLFDLQIRLDNNGFPLPASQQPVINMDIEGFFPVLINVTPVNVPLIFSEFKEFQMSLSRVE